MNIKHLRQQKAEAMAKATAILEAAEAAGNRSLTDAERVESDAALATVKTLNGDIARMEALMDEQRTAPAASGIEVGKNRASDRPWAGLGEQLQAVHRAVVTSNRDVDPRLYAALGANETVPAEGGWLVQPEFADTLLQRTYQTGIVASKCLQMPMSSNRLVINALDEDSRADGSRWGGIQAYWLAEAQQYSGTKAKFRQMQLTANKLVGLNYVSEEQMEDAAALESLIQQIFPQEFAFRIDDAIVNGSGAGQPLGILSSNAPVVVAKDSGQATGTVSTANILNMWSRMFASSRKNAVWFINQDIEPQLYPLTLGAPSLGQILVYTPPGMNGNNSGYGLLMGKPVIPIEQCAALSTQGDIILADCSQYLLAKKEGIRADSSIHVAFLTGEQAFRFMIRLDGQPTWKKPLTPKNGTQTLSAFVTLQTR